MRKTRLQLIAMGVAAAVTVGGTGINVDASASKVTNVLPSAGISYALTGDSVSLSNLAGDDTDDKVAENDVKDSAVTITETTPLASTLQENILNDIQRATGAAIPAEEPGTGTPEVGGLSFNELLGWFEYLKDFNIVGADVVELAPDYDSSGASTAVATKVIRELLMII